MPTQGSSFTNHPGVVDYKEASYLFYHNGALPGGGGFHRSVCVEEFSYNADGSIPTINMTGTRSPYIADRLGVGSLNPYDRQEAETVAWQFGVKTEQCDEGGMNISNISNDDWIEVLGANFIDGAALFEARVASKTSGGNIEIRLNGENGTLAGTCPVPDTGGMQSWETVSCDVKIKKGIHNLVFKFTGEGEELFNFNWWRFNK